MAVVKKQIRRESKLKPKYIFVMLTIILCMILLWIEHFIQQSSHYGDAGYLALSVRRFHAKYDKFPSSIMEIAKEESEYGSFIKEKMRNGGAFEGVTFKILKKNRNDVIISKFHHWTGFPLVYEQELKPGDPENDL